MAKTRKGSLVLLIGAPRSGTSWIAKILDSHPDVLYFHEPDTILRSAELPTICTREIALSPAYVAAAKKYLEKLFYVRTLKSRGSRPLFEKSYRTTSAYWLRVALIFVLRAADYVGKGGWARRIPIPEWASRQPPVTVLKSVSSRGRLALFERAMPSAHIVFILRHPCGQVASTLAGIKKGKFERRVPFDEVLVCDEARECGLTESVFQELSVIQQAAWHWAILNQKALNELEGFSQSLIVRYEDFCAEPADQSKKLLDYAGLKWSTQTQQFLDGSTATSRSDYYGVVRNSVEAAWKWRSELSPADQAEIMAIAAKVPVGKFYAFEKGSNLVGS